MKQVIWTQALFDAANALAADRTPSKWGDYATKDIRDRAREFRDVEVGTVLKGFQVEYVSCLRSRFDGERESEVAFDTAWVEAYKAA